MNGLASDKSFHIMRDHPYHGVPILAEYVGVKTLLLEKMGKLADVHDKRGHKQADQNFLAASVYNSAKRTGVVHDNFEVDHSQQKEIQNILLDKHTQVVVRY